MNQQKEFERAIMNNDINNVRLLLNDPRVDPSLENSAIGYSTEHGYTEIVKVLLENKKIDPSVDNNWVIEKASVNGHFEIVRLLLNDPRVNPSDNNNWTITFAEGNGDFNIIELLWNDKRIKNTLKEDNFNLYNKLIKKDIQTKISEF